MPRAIWKGSISFGLVSIPVGLFSAESRDADMSFRQLDKNSLSPIGYRKYNKSTGKDVELEEIVKGYEYDDDRYVLVSDEDLKRANPEKTQTVDITDFVELGDIQPEFFDKPYYLAPTNKKNQKAYALLREALKRAGKVGIAKVVIRSREYLAAVIPHGRVLVLEILRYGHEIRAFDDLELPGEDLQALGVTDREVQMAEVLIEGMTSDWTPDKYHDTYRDDLMALIHRKIESGETEVLDETPAPEVEAAETGKVIDIMSLLKRSVEAQQKARGDSAAEPSAASADTADDEEEAPAPAPAPRRRVTHRPAPAAAAPAPKPAPAPAPAAKPVAGKPRPGKPRPATTRKSA
jgi:DNA end-binding protein Ku